MLYFTSSLLLIFQSEKEGSIEKRQEGRSKIYEITEEGQYFLKELEGVQRLFNNLGFPL